MSSVLEIAQAHFAKQNIASEIDIPEWGGTFFARPYTMADKQKLLKAAGDDDMEFQARLIIAKLEDSEGKKVFDLSEKPNLMHGVCPKVVQRVCIDIQKALTVEQAEGN